MGRVLVSGVREYPPVAKSAILLEVHAAVAVAAGVAIVDVRITLELGSYLVRMLVMCTSGTRVSCKARRTDAEAVRPAAVVTVTVMV